MSIEQSFWFAVILILLAVSFCFVVNFFVWRLIDAQADYETHYPPQETYAEQNEYEPELVYGEVMPDEIDESRMLPEPRKRVRFWNPKNFEFMYCTICGKVTIHNQDDDIFTCRNH
jgi:hypothetical protein